MQCRWHCFVPQVVFHCILTEQYIVVQLLCCASADVVKEAVTAVMYHTLIWQTRRVGLRLCVRLGGKVCLVTFFLSRCRVISSPPPSDLIQLCVTPHCYSRPENIYDAFMQDVIVEIILIIFYLIAATVSVRQSEIPTVSL